LAEVRPESVCEKIDSGTEQRTGKKVEREVESESE